jgi:hypothetical protein
MSSKAEVLKTIKELERNISLSPFMKNWKFLVIYKKVRTRTL